MEKFGFLPDFKNKEGLLNTDFIKKAVFSILMFGGIQGCYSSVDINEPMVTVEKVEKLKTNTVNQKEIYGTSGCSNCGPVLGTITGEGFGSGEISMTADYYKVTLSNGKTYKTGYTYKIGQKVALKYFLVEMK